MDCILHFSGPETTPTSMKRYMLYAVHLRGTSALLAQVPPLTFWTTCSFCCYWLPAKDIDCTMSQSVDACHFQMSGRKQRGGERDATLTVTRSQNWKGADGWKAVARVDGEEKREWGKARTSIIEAVRSFTHDRSHRIRESQRHELMQHASAMHLRRGSPGSQPSSVASGQSVVQSPAADSQCDLLHNGVQIVHQIYGLFGDNKPMSILFEDSHKCWQEVAECMSARYILWTAGELESLVRQRYPQYWTMYRNVRYPVMRCDIGRMLILHAYGGLYADLDTKPNRLWYEQFELALPRVKCDPRKSKDKPGEKNHHLDKPSKALRVAGGKHSYLDMEVIVGTKGHEFFIRWLDYVSAEIKTKPYSRKNCFWRVARMRYIYHTTGPACLNRFLGLPCNVEWLAAKSLHYLECNHFSEQSELTALGRRQFDVISHESNSYFTNEHEINVPVGAGESTLPYAGRKRIFGKLASSKQPVRNEGTTADRSRDGRDTPEPHVIDRIMKESMSDRVMKDILLTDHVQQSSWQHDREAMLKRHCYENRRSRSFKIFIQDMPEKLVSWIKSDWPPDPLGAIPLPPG